MICVECGHCKAVLMVEDSKAGHHGHCPQCGHRVEIFKPGGGRRTAERLKVPFLGEIPLDPKVTIGGDAGQPIVVAEPDSAVTASYIGIAEEIARQLGAFVSS